MKLNHLFRTALLLPLALGLVACGDDQDEPTAQEYEYAQPTNTDSAARYTFLNGNSSVLSVAFGESNSVVIEVLDESGQVRRIVGTYTRQGDTYIVTTPEGQYTFVIRQEGAGGTPGGKDIVVTIVTPDADSVTDTATKTTNEVGGNPNICRTWYPFMTVINLQKQGTKGIVTDEFKGIDFEVLKNRAEQEGCHIDADLTGWKVTNVFFQGTGECGVNFANSESYFATWRWLGSNGELDLDWQDKNSLDNEFVGKSKARAEIYTTGIYRGECWLRLKSAVEQDNGDVWDVEVIFRLTEKPV